MARKPKSPLARTLREIIDVRRLENATFKKAVKEINRLDRIIAEELAAQGKLTSRSGVKLSNIRKRIRAEVNRTFSRINQLVGNDTTQVGILSGEEAQNTLEFAVGSTIARGAAKTTDFVAEGVASNVVQEMVELQIVEGQPLADWWAQESARTKRKFTRVLNDSLKDGLTLPETVAVFAGGAATKEVRRNSRALIRTAFNQIANATHMAVYQNNQEVTQSYIYQAVLDGRTSDICISLDNTVYRYDDPARKVPPQHINCRSWIEPVIEYGRLGIEPPKESRKAAARNLSGQSKESARASGRTTSVPQGTTYEKWLTKQPKSFQDEVLGNQKAELWRDGRITLKDLVDKDNKSLTVEQLRAQGRGRR